MNETGAKSAGFATAGGHGLQQVLQGLTARTPKLMSSLAFQAGPVGESSNGRLGNAAEKRLRFTTSPLENISFSRFLTAICNTHFAGSSPMEEQEVG